MLVAVRLLGLRPRSAWYRVSTLLSKSLLSSRKAKNGQHEAGRHDLDGAGLHIFDAVDEGLQLAAAAGVSQLAERSAGV
jgi:hypothetical protein